MLGDLITLAQRLPHDEEDLDLPNGGCSDHLIENWEFVYDERCLRCLMDKAIKDHKASEPGWIRCELCGTSEYMDNVDREFAIRLFPELVTETNPAWICHHCCRLRMQAGLAITAFIIKGGWMRRAILRLLGLEVEQIDKKGGSPG